MADMNRYKRLITCMAPFTVEQDAVYEQVHAEAAELWKKLNTWGVTFEDLIEFGYHEGCLENPGPRQPFDRYLLGDVVYVHPEGGCMTRAMSYDLYRDWGPFLNGYMRGYYAAKQAESV